MYKNIAVATDGSAMGGKAVDTAAKLAALCDAELTIVHILMHGEPPEAFRHMAEVEHIVKEHPHVQTALDNVPRPFVAMASSVESHRLDDEVIGAMGDYVAKHAKKVAQEAGVKTVNTEVLNGDTAHQIIDAAKRHNTDLIVVGTRGLGPLKELLMGSISRKITQAADCACLVVK